MNSTTVALITMLAVLSAVVWFDARCLADLARTDPRYFNHNVWAIVIVFSFPIGPMLYLRYAKLPRR